MKSRAAKSRTADLFAENASPAPAGSWQAGVPTPTPLQPAGRPRAKQLWYAAVFPQLVKRTFRRLTAAPVHACATIYFVRQHRTAQRAHAGNQGQPEAVRPAFACRHRCPLAAARAAGVQRHGPIDFGGALARTGRNGPPRASVSRPTVPRYAGERSDTHRRTRDAARPPGGVANRLHGVGYRAVADVARHGRDAGR